MVDQCEIDDIVRHFEDLEDPRSEVNLQHPLISVVVISLMAVLAGAAGPTAIARWAQLKADELLNVLPLPNGIPRKDVFAACFRAQAGSLSNLFRELVGVVACRCGGGDGHPPTDFGGGWKDAAAEP